jgi:hypothetical protein
MSLLSIGAVGIYRDLAPRAARISAKAGAVADTSAGPHRGPATAGTTVGDGAGGTQDAGSVASFAQMLVAQIPSEALVAYTTLLAVFAVGGGGYQPGRWILYGLSLPACAAAVICSYLAKRGYGFQDAPAGDPGPRALTAHLPWLPMRTSVLAMAVYGLNVPGNALQHSMSATGFGITAGCLAVGGGLMMAGFAPFLAKGNGAAVVPAHTPAHASIRATPAPAPRP